jgi:hypothetical protein
MALMKCRECGSDVSTSAGACPKCGAPVVTAPGALKRIAKAVGYGFAGLIALTVIGGIASKKSASSSASPSTLETAAIQGAQAVAAAAARGTLDFGKPTVKVTMGMTEVAVEAKNVSGQDVGACMVIATFKKGDAILGTANGAVNQLPAGATRTAQLMGSDNVTGYDTLKLEASSCF